MQKLQTKQKKLKHLLQMKALSFSILVIYLLLDKILINSFTIWNNCREENAKKEKSVFPNINNYVYDFPSKPK